MDFLSQLKASKFLSQRVDRRLRDAASFRPAFETLEDRTVPAAIIGVNATANVHAIDPNVYGTAFASTQQLADLSIPINRNGGNASDTYNMQQDATNHGSDWFFESLASGSGNGQGMQSWVAATQAGGAQADVTVNLFDWGAKLQSNRGELGSFPGSQYPSQQQWDPTRAIGTWGNGLFPNGSKITGNDPNWAYVPNSPSIEQAWIQDMLNRGVRYFTMGNEPGLWNSTHRDIHPNGQTHTELLNDIINYASMIKSLNPNAKILGPEEWGWTNYFISGADSAASNWGATYNGLAEMPWLLQQLQQHDAATGQRLLDYFTLHFYPQGGQFSNDVSTNMELLRNRSTRSLWDPNYVDESWIANTGINGGKVNLIHLMQNWVSTYYPGTKTGITEYNWGAEGDMNGATTQADIWGIFGREGLDLGTRWTTPATGSPTYLAMKLWRNYDGSNHGFGDTSVSASVGNPDQVDAFAATRSSDGALTVAVINKNLVSSGANTTITINLSGFNSNGVAQDWQLAAINPSDQTRAAISRLSDIRFSGNTITVTVPNESVSMFVIMPGSATSAPTITSNPSSQTVTAGQAASFTAATTGSPAPSVQWQVSSNGGASFTNIAGATSTTYSFTTTTSQSGNQYRAVFTNSVGSATTGAATLTVNAAVTAPSITTQPASQTVNAGQSVSFSVTATGTAPLTYQWQKLVNGAWNNIGGATSPTYTISSAAASAAGSYWVIVSNSAGSATSNSATLTVNAPVATGGVSIDAGGGAVGPFVADTGFSGGASRSTPTAISTSGVANAAPAAVYQSQRYGNFSYTVGNLTAGPSYSVRLHFAEFVQNAAGKRTFSVAINGTTVLSNFDVFATAGGFAKALVEQFSATADGGGKITVTFTNGNNNSILSGIEVLKPGVAIHAGGGAVGSFLADGFFSGGTTSSTTAAIDTSGVTNAAPQSVYQTERYGTFTYTIPNLTPGATYTVRLHFAEIYWTAAGQRVFNVKINGQQVLTNFDIFAATGAKNKAIVKQFTATADAGGKITVDFISVVNFAKLSGLEII